MTNEYNHRAIEEKWQKYWAAQKIYSVTEDPTKPKYYVLDMFPYPSGAGLHVGHPLGYIASDIYSRFKRLKGFNVLHPMGYDAFGLPAEQYAIQTGQHPAITTDQNIKRYRQQLDKIGFSYDWDREVRTSDPAYYKWTQWIFIQLFNAWFNPITEKAEPILSLIKTFETEGFNGSDDKILTGGMEFDYPPFTATQWKAFSEPSQRNILLGFRLAYLSEAYVNWCPALGTVLSNDEVKDGVSERGGYAVERKLMNQWSLRITAYADRLLSSLDNLDWSESMKESQRNWIGKSQGASLSFKVQDQPFSIEVFTTRPDTVFGASFLAIAPEHEMLEQLVDSEHQQEVMEYVDAAKNRSERERMADVKRITGEFTGAYAVHPFTGKEIEIWVADYVLGGYGTGAVMGVPAHDSRDHAFAMHFNLPVLPVIDNGSNHDYKESSFDAKDGNCVHSGFLNGLGVKKAIKKAIAEIELRKLGKGKTNFRLRDAIFGRQRYWGEPIPVYYKDGIPYVLDENELPLILPEIDTFLPTESGEPPLARATNWKHQNQYDYELSTMPGWAGSSWYFLRYMDPGNKDVFVSKKAVDYWGQVDLYLGGSEHATGHLLYVRFWTKFLFDLGLIPSEEPAKKLINQGMIQGISYFTSEIMILGISPTHKPANIYTGILVSEGFRKRLYEEYSSSNNLKFKELLVNNILGNSKKQNLISLLEEAESYQISITPVKRVHIDHIDSKSEHLNIEKFREWDMNNGLEFEFIMEDGSFVDLEKSSYSGSFICRSEVEKMSKSKFNVVNPDEIIEQYGADTLRLYEMFLGPLEQSKPWNTQGIEGVQRFLKKLWRLFFDANGSNLIISVEPTKTEWKALHKTIRKVADDIENFSFNTSVSTFMICVNELTDLKCHKYTILKDFLIVLSPYAPHISEELWQVLGEKDSITKSTYPLFNPEYLIEDSFNYPVSINGKHRTNISFMLSAAEEEVKQKVMADDVVQKWLDGNEPKKVIFVKGKIVNIVI